MLLYDGQSAIDWFYDALLTADEMMEREEYAHIFDGPAVLYDNGDGKAYGWETLEALCGKWAVPFSDDAASAFSALVEAMNNPLPQVTPEELKKVSDTATAAQQKATDTEVAAAELGVIASQAISDGTDTQAAVAELGGLVADLTARVTALEGAKA